MTDATTLATRIAELRNSVAADGNLNERIGRAIDALETARRWAGTHDAATDAESRTTSAHLRDRHIEIGECHAREVGAHVPHLAVTAKEAASLPAGAHLARAGRGMWFIKHTETGLNIGPSYGTRKRALEFARQLLGFDFTRPLAEIAADTALRDIVTAERAAAL